MQRCDTSTIGRRRCAALQWALFREVALCPFRSFPESALKLLGQYDTPTICNVIEFFKVRPQTSGYMDGRIRACFPELPPMVGYASTATFRSAAAPRAGADYAGLEQQVDEFANLPQPTVVVIQDLDSPPGSRHLRGSDDDHLQGIRLGGTDHERRRP